MAKDKYHNLVRDLIEKDGWTITADPLYFKMLSSRIEIDLGAERIIAAEKENEKIAIEIKSFLGHSTLTDFYKAVGQFAVYLQALNQNEPNRKLYLAIPSTAYDFLFKDAVVKAAAEKNDIKLIVFSPKDEKIILWKK